MKTVQERLKEYGKQCQPALDEDRVKEAVWRGQAAFFEEAEKCQASYFDFFWQQAGYIRKRWWGLQLLALTLLWCWVRNVSEKRGIQGAMGVMAAVFAILLIPELWKNRAANAMEVEGSTYYSLWQIYAARMLAFGVVDIGLLSVFMVVVSVTTSIQAKEMVIYFFLPFTVACCILFRTLGSGMAATQMGTMSLALFWMGVWLFVVTNEQIYLKVSIPAWGAMLLLAAAYLVFAVKKAVTTCENFVEVEIGWN